MQRRIDPEAGVNKPFENVSCQGRIQKFFQDDYQFFCHISSVIFFDSFNSSNFSNKNDSMGIWEHAPPEKF